LKAWVSEPSSSDTVVSSSDVQLCGRKRKEHWSAKEESVLQNSKQQHNRHLIMCMVVRKQNHF